MEALPQIQGSCPMPAGRWIHPARHSRLPAVPAAQLQYTDARFCYICGAANLNHSDPTQAKCSLSLINLWCQVELHVAIVCLLEVILHKQGRIWPEAKLHSATERRRFGEVHEVTERKRRCHRFMHCEGHLLFRFFGLPRLEHHVASTNITLHAECNALLTCLHLHGLSELLQVSANLLELSRGQLCRHLVVLLRNLHVLAFDLHELQVEVGNAVLFAAFALEAHDVSVTPPSQLQ